MVARLVIASFAVSLSTMLLFMEANVWWIYATISETLYSLGLLHCTNYIMSKRI